MGKVRGKNKNHKVMLMITSLVMIIVIAVLWRTIWYMPTPSAVMQQIEKQVNAHYANLATDTSPWPAQKGSQLILQASGYSFNVSSQSMTSMYIGMQDGNNSNSKPKASSPEAAHQLIADQMKRDRFAIDKDNNKPPSVLYSRRHTTCLEMYDSSQSVLTFSCYDHSEIAQKSKDAQPFVDAYNKANNTSPINLAAAIGPIVVKSHYGGGVIGSSHAAGYDIAEAVVTKGIQKQLVLFYQKYHGPWQYITQAGDEFGFSCDAYKTNNDVRAAMYDQVCLSSTGPVRLDTNNRATQ